MSRRIVFSVGFLIVAMTTTFISSLVQRNFELNQLTLDHENYRKYIYKYFNQPWMLVAITNNSRGSIKSGLDKFADKHTTCLRFFFFQKGNSREEIGHIGSCDFRENKIPSQTGWSNNSENLILYEKYHNGVETLIYLDNPRHITIVDGHFYLGISPHHFFLAVPYLVLALAIFIFLFFSIAGISDLLKKKTRQIHDYRKVSTDDRRIADKLLENYNKPDEILKIASIEKKISNLKDSMLYVGELKIESYRLTDLLEEFLDAFFHTKDKTLLSYTPPSKKIFILGDKRYLFKALGNMFDNAIYEIAAAGELNFSVLEGTRTVEISLTNDGTVDHTKIRPGYSSRKSGLGLGIISESLLKMGSKLHFLCLPSKVCVCFTMQKDIEAMKCIT